MIVLRWILFIPVGFICTGIAQLIVMAIATALNPILAFVAVFFFNVMNAMAGMVPMMIAPNPKVALWIFLPLFLIFEYVGFTKTGVEPMTGAQTACRILGDVGLILGMIAGGYRDRTHH